MVRGWVGCKGAQGAALLKWEYVWFYGNLNQLHPDLQQALAGFQRAVDAPNTAEDGKFSWKCEF